MRYYSSNIPCLSRAIRRSAELHRSRGGHREESTNGHLGSGFVGMAVRQRKHLVEAKVDLGGEPELYRRGIVSRKGTVRWVRLTALESRAVN
jgi:hypothetical protein